MTTNTIGQQQATQIGLGNVAGATNLLKLDYSYNTPNVADNNGNLKSQTISVPGVGASQGFVATQNYEYDSLNRLKSASETIGGGQSWKQTFVYDRFGNRNFDVGNTTTLGSCPAAVCNPTIDISNNRFTTAQGYQYDLSGNIITDAEGRTFTYDAENKQKEVRDVNNVVVGTYLYDGDGRRVKKISNTETVIFVYDAEGKLIAEYANQPPQNPQVSYLTSDALGSPRIKTDANGNVISRSDNLPFGEDLYTAQRTQGLGYQPDSIRRKFTTYKRDDETGLDFAEARYYSSRWGRFVSPDEFAGGPDELFDFTNNASDNPTFYADLTNPQSLNKYQYTYNNPLNLIDSNGHHPTGKKDYPGNAEINLKDYSYLLEGSKYESYLRYSQSQPRPLPRRGVRRSGGNLRPSSLPRRRAPKTPARAFGPGLNEAHQRESLEKELGQVTLIPLFGPQREYPRYANQYSNHHIFPQAGEFAQFWNRAGIDINQFTIRIPRGGHIQLHSGIGQGRGGAWNNAWREFFRRNPNASREQIFKQGNLMILQLQVVGPNVHYKYRPPSISPRE